METSHFEPGVIFSIFGKTGITSTVNREIFAALKVGELAVDKIPRLLQKFNG
jgi:hypothetical protein